MLFASTELAARIERAECRLLTDGADVIARGRERSDGFVTEIAGGVAVYTVEGSPLNKLAGLGFAGPVDAVELDAVERAFAERGASVHAEVSCLADLSVCATLTRRGYLLQGFENVLGRNPRSMAQSRGPAGEGIEVAPSDHTELDTWIDVVVTGFLTPDTQGVPSHEPVDRAVHEPIIRDFCEAAGVVRYLARRDGVPVGGASMRLFDGVAHLCGATTLPEHRRRGVQTALLERRLADARRAGCDVAVVMTQPGSKSQQNVQRQGFELLYTRAVLIHGA